MWILLRFTTDFVAPKEVFRSPCRFLRRKMPPPGKPPILPPSKQKLYSFKQPEWIPPDVVQELLWRRHIYNNAVLSMRRVFKEDFEHHSEESLGSLEGTKKEEVEELDRLIQENNERNRKKAVERAERERLETEELRAKTLQEIEDILNMEEEDLKHRTDEVLDMIERSKNFMTRENAEHKILEALENPVVFEYALDLNGRKYFSPTPVKYTEGVPTRQKGRIYDLSHGGRAKIGSGGDTEVSAKSTSN